MFLDFQSSVSSQAVHIMHAWFQPENYLHAIYMDYHIIFFLGSKMLSFGVLYFLIHA